MEIASPKANPDGVVEPSSPPRPSDSDWSDIDTDEETNLTDDDEDIDDKLHIDIPKKRKRARNVTKSPDNTELISLDGTAKAQPNNQ